MAWWSQIFAQGWRLGVGSSLRMSAMPSTYKEPLCPMIYVLVHEYYYWGTGGIGGYNLLTHRAVLTFEFGSKRVKDKMCFFVFFELKCVFDSLL